MPGSDNNGLTTTPPRWTENQQRILLAMAAGKTTTATIAKHTGKNRGNVYRTLKTLIEKKLASQQEATKQYFLTSSGKDLALKITEPQLTTKSSHTPRSDNRRDPLRGHRISIRIPIKRPVPKDWQARVREILVKERVDFSTSDMRHHYIDSFKLDKYTIKTTASSVLVMFERADYRNLQQFWLDVTPLVLEAVDDVQKRYGVKMDLSKQLSVCQLEVADERNGLAEASEDNYVVFYDEKSGERRLLVDRSQGPAELEAVNRRLSDEDMQVILACMAQYADGAKQPKDVEVMLEQGEYELGELRNIVGGWINNQRAYMENIKSHLATEKATQEAVQRLAENSAAQTRILERLEERLG